MPSKRTRPGTFKTGDIVRPKFPPGDYVLKVTHVDENGYLYFEGAVMPYHPDAYVKATAAHAK